VARVLLPGENLSTSRFVSKLSEGSRSNLYCQTMHTAESRRRRRRPPNATTLKFRWLPGPYGHRAARSRHGQSPSGLPKGDFTSITRTADELSIVLPPAEQAFRRMCTRRTTGFCYKLEGPVRPSRRPAVLLSFIEPLSGETVSRSSPSRRTTRTMC